jgi:uncharacterized protein (DUF302 family)
MDDDVNDALETTTKLSPISVEETVEKLLSILHTKGLKVFTVIDQRAEARLVGLDLRETTLVIFGNPVAGTPVMESVPLAALDLPLKVLIWADGAQTKVSYAATDYFVTRHHLAPELRGNLEGIDALTDALVGDAPS